MKTLMFSSVLERFDACVPGFHAIAPIKFHDSVFVQLFAEQIDDFVVMREKDDLVTALLDDFGDVGGDERGFGDSGRFTKFADLGKDDLCFRSETVDRLLIDRRVVGGLGEFDSGFEFGESGFVLHCGFLLSVHQFRFPVRGDFDDRSTFGGQFRSGHQLLSRLTMQRERSPSWSSSKFVAPLKSQPHWLRYAPA